MRRVIQCSGMLLSICSAIAIAGGYDYTKEDLSGYSLQPDLRINNDSGYRTGHAVYFFTGYIYSKRFLSDSPRILFSPTLPVISYIPKSIFPDTFHGMELGVGKEWSHHIDFQLSYFHFFPQKRIRTISGVTYDVSQKINGLLGDVAYIFNPDDEFQISGKVGAAISGIHTAISLGGLTYGPIEDETKIDPAIGLACLFQVSPHLGFHIGATYIADTQTPFSSGEVNILAGMRYTL